MGQQQTVKRDRSPGQGEPGSAFSSTGSVCTLQVLNHAAHIAGEPNEQGETIIHEAAKDENPQFLIAFLSFLGNNGQSASKIILSEDKQYKWNCLQYAAAAANTSAMVVLVEQLSTNDLMSALTSKDRRGNNCLSLAVLHCPDDRVVMEKLVGGLNDEQASRLMLTNNRDGKNALQFVVEASKLEMLFYLQQRLQDEYFNIHRQLLVSLHCQKVIDWAIVHDDDRLLKACVIHQAEAIRGWLEDGREFSQKQLLIMWPAMKTYKVPVGLRRPKRHAFVCYNPTNRENAVEEARKLLEAFEATNFEAHICEWTNYVDLRTWITEEIGKIKAKAYILALFVMCHGSSGRLHSDNGAHGSITDLIHDARQGLPHEIPLLVGIQACQRDEEPDLPIDVDTDAQEVLQKDTNFIRFAAENCTLFMATVHGRYAYRQHFITAFGDVLRDAHQTSVYEIFTAICERMKNDPRPDYRCQLPEMRCTGSVAIKL